MWKVLALKEITDKPIVYGIVQAGPEVPGGIPYIKSTDVGGEIDLSKLSNTSYEIANKYKRSEVNPGQIVFSLRGNIGQVSIVPAMLKVANLTQGTARISVNNSQFSTAYIAYALRSRPVIREINKVAKGSTFREISLAQLRNIQLPIPGLPEQIAIANLLATWDRAIAVSTQLIAQKELRKKWLMRELLTGKRRLGYNENWERKAACEFLEVRREFAVNDGRIPLFSLTIEEGITPKTERYEREFLVKNIAEKKYKVVYPNDIVFNPANLRWGAIAKNNFGYKVLVSPIYEVMHLKRPFDVDFVSSLVTSPNQIKFYASIVEGTLVERMAVKVEAFLAIHYDIPQLAEQKVIANVIKESEKELFLLKRLVESLDQQKQGLIQALLTGRTRLNL
ncbi:MAG: restriction endonuclease subunit S [Bacteroidetes bacterium]|nr:restriction endonuclease subunit S [Bacteroidota bacterium]